MFCHPALPYPRHLPPSPFSPRPRPPPLPEAAPPPPHDLSTQRDAAASLHPASRGSAQTGAPCLILASACALSRSPQPSVPHSQRGNCGKETEGLQPNDGATQRHVSGSQGGSNSPSVCVWAGPHLSSDASLPTALRCELYEVDSKGRIIPGCCPIMATRQRANRDSLFRVRRMENGFGQPGVETQNL